MQILTVTTAKNELSTYAPEAINEGAKKLLLNSKSSNTKLAYKKQVSYFCMWCKNEGINFAVNYSDTDITVTGLDDLKPTHIANYVSYLVSTGKTSSTIVSTIAAINSVTIPFDYAPAKTHLVKTIVEGAKRTIGVAPQKAKAINPNEITLNLNTIKQHYPNEAIQLRNTALLLLGFVGAFRRSELVSLKVSDFQIVDTTKATFYIAKSKTDQTGKGDFKPVERSSVKQACAINAVQNFIAFAGLGKDDYLFPSIHKSGKVQTKPLSGKDVSLIVKTILGTDFSAHSLRSGFVTECSRRGKTIAEIKAVSLHKTDTVVMGYIQTNDKLKCAFDIFS